MKFTNEELTVFAKVIDAPTDDFGTLVEIAGLDPRRDLRGMDLSRVDFGTCDCSHFDFDGADLRGADLSKVSQLRRWMIAGARRDQTTRLPPYLLPGRSIASDPARRSVREMEPGRTFPKGVMKWHLDRLGDEALDKLITDSNWDDNRTIDDMLVPTEAFLDVEMLNLDPERFEGQLRGRIATFERFERLREFTDLVDVTLDNTRLRDVDWAIACRKIRSLSIRGTAVSDIAPLAHLPDLRELYLDGARVSDLTPLSGLKSLRTLSLSRCPVHELTPLSMLRSLVWLDVSWTRVVDLSPLCMLKHLFHLNISETKVTDVSCLRKLSALEEVDCTATKVEDFSAIEHIPQLKRSVGIRPH